MSCWRLPARLDEGDDERSVGLALGSPSLMGSAAGAEAPLGAINANRVGGRRKMTNDGG